MKILFHILYSNGKYKSIEIKIKEQITTGNSKKDVNKLN